MIFFFFFAALRKRKYKILEVGDLPGDLESEDDILDPFCWTNALLYIILLFTFFFFLSTRNNVNDNISGQYCYHVLSTYEFTAFSVVRAARSQQRI